MGERRAILGTAEAQAKRRAASRSRRRGLLAPLVARARDSLGPQAFSEAEASGSTNSYDNAQIEVGAWLEQLC